MSGQAWTDRERAVIRRHYANIGPAACFVLLPHRSADSIKQEANRLGITQARNVYCDRIVVVMRQLRFEGRLKCRELSRMFGGNEHTVNRATNGVTYAHVPMPWELEA